MGNGVGRSGVRDATITISGRRPRTASHSHVKLVGSDGASASTRSRPTQRNAGTRRAGDVHGCGCCWDVDGECGAVGTRREAVAMIIDCSDHEVVLVVSGVRRPQTSGDRGSQHGISGIRSAVWQRPRQVGAGAACTARIRTRRRVPADGHPARSGRSCSISSHISQRGGVVVLPPGDGGAAVAAGTPREGDHGIAAGRVVDGTSAQVRRCRGLGARVHGAAHRGGPTSTGGVHGPNLELIGRARSQAAHLVVLGNCNRGASTIGAGGRYGRPLAVFAVTRLLRIFVADDRESRRC